MIQRKPILTAMMFAAAMLMATAAKADLTGYNEPRFLQAAERAGADGKPDQVVRILTPRAHTLRNARQRQRAYSALCRAQLEIQDYTAAENACAHAANTRFSDWSDFNNRGVVRFKTGDFNAALQFFEQAAKLNPRSEDVRKNLNASLAILRTFADNHD